MEGCKQERKSKLEMEDQGKEKVEKFFPHVSEKKMIPLIRSTYGNAAPSPQASNANRKRGLALNRIVVSTGRKAGGTITLALLLMSTATGVSRDEATVFYLRGAHFVAVSYQYIVLTIRQTLGHLVLVSLLAARATILKPSRVDIELPMLPLAISPALRQGCMRITLRDTSVQSKSP